MKIKIAIPCSKCGNEESDVGMGHDILNVNIYAVRCCNCGYMSEPAKTDFGAIEKWNGEHYGEEFKN